MRVENLLSRFRNKQKRQRISDTQPAHYEPVASLTPPKNNQEFEFEKVIAQQLEFAEKNYFSHFQELRFSLNPVLNQFRSELVSKFEQQNATASKLEIKDAEISEHGNLVAKQSNVMDQLEKTNRELQEVISTLQSRISKLSTSSIHDTSPSSSFKTNTNDQSNKKSEIAAPLSQKFTHQEAIGSEHLAK